MNCTGCGVELDPSQDQVNAAVDDVLRASLQDAHQHAGVCPLCGHSKEIPVSKRRPVLFALLVAAVLAAGAVGFLLLRSQNTQRAAAANDALAP